MEVLTSPIDGNDSGIISKRMHASRLEKNFCVALVMYRIFIVTRMSLVVDSRLFCLMTALSIGILLLLAACISGTEMRLLSLRLNLRMMLVPAR